MIGKVETNFAERFKIWFDDNKKITFKFALIVGFLTHIILLSSYIEAPDGLWNSIIYSANSWETYLGRWLIDFIDSLRQNLAIPAMTTIFSVILIGITSVLITDLLEIKSKISCVLIAIFLEVSPCLAVTLLYAFTADAYAFAFLFATLAVWFMYKQKDVADKILLGSLFSMLSISIYQSYMGVTVGLCIIKPISDLLNNKDYKKVCKDIVISISAVLISFGLYWVLVKLFLKLYTINMLTDYCGANKVGLVNTIKNLPTTLVESYTVCAAFFFGNSIVNNAFMNRHIWYICLFILEIIVLILALKGKDKINKILVCLFSILLPLGLNIIVPIVPEAHYYTLNTAHLIVMIPYFMVLLEKLDSFKILNKLCIIICVVIAFSYYLTDNATYMGIKMKYDQTYSLAIRMVSQIENLEEYDKNKPWLINGVMDENSTEQLKALSYYSIDKVSSGSIFHSTYDGMLNTWKSFLRIFLGIEPTFCEKEEFYRIISTDEFKNMPVFPEKGAVKEIDGIIVVKLSDKKPIE